MTSYHIVRHGPCYVNKIKALPTSYAIDNVDEANRKIDSLNNAAIDLCKYYMVVARSSEEAESLVKDLIEK
jgi:hypothetical protein